MIKIFLTLILSLFSIFTFALDSGIDLYQCKGGMYAEGPTYIKNKDSKFSGNTDIRLTTSFSILVLDISTSLNNSIFMYGNNGNFDAGFTSIKPNKITEERWTSDSGTPTVVLSDNPLEIEYSFDGVIIPASEAVAYYHKHCLSIHGNRCKVFRVFRC